MSGDSERNLQLFQKMVQAVHKVNFWTFDSNLNLIKLDCDKPDEMLYFFSFEKEQVANLIVHANTLSPVILTNQLSMIWIVDFEPDDCGKTAYLHLIGPVFTETQSLQSIKQKLFSMTLSNDLRENFSAIIDTIPVIPFTHFLEYGIMMHYCITEEEISVSDFSYITPPHDYNNFEEESSDRHYQNIWSTEQKMLKLIEEGNLNYRNYVNQLSYIADIGHVGNGDPVRQVKNLAIIYTALCTRSAIKGGLDPDIAYNLSDRYINSIENCKEIPNIAEINATMQTDFVERVHRRRNHTEISPQIQKCCAYIQLHLSEQISLSRLSRYMGYSESHLSKKFKEDTGKTIKEYIMECRIEQAKQLLHTTNLQIADICEQLGFTSQSYFGSQFRKSTGMTPSEYRNSLIEPYQS